MRGGEESRRERAPHEDREFDESFERLSESGQSSVIGVVIELRGFLRLTARCKEWREKSEEEEEV